MKNCIQDPRKPYEGQFRISQEYKPGLHRGLDLVGITSKKIFSINEGIVDYAGWENINNKKQGFGLYIRVKMINNWYCYYGHLSSVYIKAGDQIKEGTFIGNEGSTGNSTGSHLHIEIRKVLGDYNSYIDIKKYMNLDI